MNYCQYCGTSNPATVFNCLKCAAMMPVAPAPAQNITVVQQRPLRPKPEIRMVVQTEKYPITRMSWKEVGIYFTSAFLVIAVVWGALYFMSIAAPQSAALVSITAPVLETKTIKSTGGILLATTEDNFNEMMKAAVAGDDAYLVRMGAEGKLFRLQDGTKIRVVDGGMFKSKVSALEGNQAGRGGWLPNEFISN